MTRQSTDQQRHSFRAMCEECPWSSDHSTRTAAVDEAKTHARRNAHYFSTKVSQT